jgi:hypothetical protein
VVWGAHMIMPQNTLGHEHQNMKHKIHDLIKKISTQTETISIIIQKTKEDFDKTIEEKNGRCEIFDMEKVLASYSSVITQYNELLRNTTTTLSVVVKTMESQNENCTVKDRLQ